MLLILHPLCLHGDLLGKVWLPDLSAGFQGVGKGPRWAPLNHGNDLVPDLAIVAFRPHLPDVGNPIATKPGVHAK